MKIFFNGSGFDFWPFVGYYTALMESERKIDTLYVSSGSVIFGLLYASGYNVSEMESVCKKINKENVSLFEKSFFGKEVFVPQKVFQKLSKYFVKSPKDFKQSVYSVLVDKTGVVKTKSWYHYDTVENIFLDCVRLIDSSPKGEFYDISMANLSEESFPDNINLIVQTKSTRTIIKSALERMYEASDQFSNKKVNIYTSASPIKMSYNEDELKLFVYQGYEQCRKS